MDLILTPISTNCEQQKASAQPVAFPYKATPDGEVLEYLMEVSDFGHVNSGLYSLRDFLAGKHVDGMDLSDRLAMMDSYIKDHVVKGHHQYRRTSYSGSGPSMEVLDQYGEYRENVINLASNDYLNLTQHPEVVSAAERALRDFGAGAGSVPLLAGTLSIHRQLEEATAKLKGCEAAMLFTSGYGSNYAVLSTLLRSNDVAIVDILAHASLYDGCKHTNQLLFRHNDLESLEKQLIKAQKKFINKIVVIDGVYSMDGDIAKLSEILDLAHSYGALVLVDEAHATGVIGAGKGTPHHCDVVGKVDIVCGTYSKALGGVGGFIAGSQRLINYLQLLSRPYMFSTAPTPSVTGGLIAAINVVEHDALLREKLWSNIGHLSHELKKHGFDLGLSETAIMSIIIPDEAAVKDICRDLMKQQIMVNPVVFPAVPKRKARIRASVTAGHSHAQLDEFVVQLLKASRKAGVR